MSHFTVLVIGPDPEQQLERFSEEYTVEAYYEQVDAEDIEAAEEGLGFPTLAKPDADHLQHLVDWLNEQNTDGDDEEPAYKILDGTIQRRSTRNQEGKWDWHSLGGRWKDFFPVKTKHRGKKGIPGAFNKGESQKGCADSLKKKAIDFDKARAGTRAEAEKLWVLWEKALEGNSKPLSWTEVREAFGDRRIDEARDVYAGHPAIVAAKELAGFLSCPVEVFGFDKEAYLKRVEDGTLVPYAVLKDDVWHQRGEMGWFGMSSDEMSQDDWNKWVREMYDGLDDDTLVSLYDCHV